MKLQRVPLLICVAFLLACVTGAMDQSEEPFKFFRDYIGLNESQMGSIREGKAFAKVLDSPEADEVFIFGAVRIEAPPEHYLAFSSDVDHLRKLPSYLAIQKFSDPPQLSDLKGFSLDEEDLKHLKDCKPGHCEVQLPSENMEAFQRSVNWSAPDAADQANRLAQQMALQALQNYRQGGNTALGTYRDKDHPAAVAATFASLLARDKALPAYLPDLNHYLLEYPNAQKDTIQSEFYWEKVNFGLKPTLRVVQAIVYRGQNTGDPAYAVAIKQLYASHYFESALDLSVCIRDDQKGFYLVTLKGSRQEGLNGFKGGIVRKVAVDKSRSSLEHALTSIKETLESPSH